MSKEEITVFYIYSLKWHAKLAVILKGRLYTQSFQELKNLICFSQTILLDKGFNERNLPRTSEITNKT